MAFTEEQVRVWTIRKHELLQQNKALQAGDLSVRVKYEAGALAPWLDVNDRIIQRNNEWISDLDVLLSQSAETAIQIQKTRAAA